MLEKVKFFHFLWGYAKRNRISAERRSSANTISSCAKTVWLKGKNWLSFPATFL